MTSKQHEEIYNKIKAIRQLPKTTLKVPYKDTVSGYSQISKEVLLKGYTNSLGKTIQYLERSWIVDAVNIVGEEIWIELSK